MTKWCYVQNGNLIDIVEVDPAINIFHPDYAALFETLANVDGSYVKDSEGNFIAPTEEVSTPPYRKSIIDRSEFSATALGLSGKASPLHALPMQIWRFHDHA